MKNETLMGGRKLTVNFEPKADGSLPPPEEILVRQVPTREYDSGLQFYEDEIARTAFICGKPKEWALSLTPESYESVRAAGEEVNVKHFFGFCERRMSAFLALPADFRNRAVEAAAATSPTSSPAQRPRRA